MKQKIRIVIIAVALIALCGVAIMSGISLPKSVSASTSGFQEQMALPTDIHVLLEVQQFSSATIDDNFADNVVLVVLNKEATFSNSRSRSFSEINYTRIDDLTELTSNIVEKQQRAERTRDWGALQSRADSNMLVETDNFRRILRIELEERCKQNVLNAIRLLETRGDVLYVGPDYIMRPLSSSFQVHPSPAPIHYAHQWSFDNIDLQYAWNITAGSSDIRVGVIDSGIDITHPDLVDRVCTYLSRDFSFNDNPDPFFDDAGHGTHVAGIIGANRDMGVPGVIGVAWDVTLVSLKFMHNRTGNSSNALMAIDFATYKGIEILNFSAGWWDSDPGQFSEYVYSLYRAIQNFPGLFIAAAGNNGYDNDANGTFPTNYRLTNLISVGSLSRNNDRSWFSNWGVNTVDVFAPSGDFDFETGDVILSTFPELYYGLFSWEFYTSFAKGYALTSGTSMAAPHVAGVAALIMSAHPNLSARQVRNAILDGAIPTEITLPNGSTQNVVRLNAYYALLAAADTGPRFIYIESTSSYAVCLVDATDEIVYSL